jgi:hypothetical protein
MALLIFPLTSDAAIIGYVNLAYKWPQRWQTPVALIFSGTALEYLKARGAAAELNGNELIRARYKVAVPIRQC